IEEPSFRLFRRARLIFSWNGSIFTINSASEIEETRSVSIKRDLISTANDFPNLSRCSNIILIGAKENDPPSHGAVLDVRGNNFEIREIRQDFMTIAS
ncbi:hypothetical protein PFISCL1PPCAC_24823, partial [Pristionchus fissidentatus]